MDAQPPHAASRLSLGRAGYRALVTTPDGDPLVIEGPLGKGRIILALAPGLPWNWGSVLLTAARGTPLERGQHLVPGSPSFGSMVLAALDGGAVELPAWSRGEELAAFIADPAKARPATDERPSEPGETFNGALGVPFALAPGESRTVTFAIAWHFPNVSAL